MAPLPNSKLDVRLIVPANHPDLLAGLEMWLELGLLSDAQVRRLCQENLACPLPQAVPRGSRPTAHDQDFAAIAVERRLPVNRGNKLPTRPSAKTPTVAQPRPWINQAAQSFATEIGVIWLLALGVFLVVVSSGVLAASQWRNFSTVAQYAILLGYTLAFWGASVWAASRPQLHLTAHMLQIATLLLIPVNVWMMDGLHLWRSPGGGGVGAIATGLLSLLTVRLIHTDHEPPSLNRLRSANAVALSWLHWGWGWAGVPLGATYIGTLGTIACLVYQSLDTERRSQHKAGDASNPVVLSPSAIAIGAAVLLLAGRAVLIASVPLNQLGLAFGLWGWLLVWQSRGHAERLGWSQGGWLLLILGWLATVSSTPPWQAIAISGLALWLLAEALWRQGRTVDLTALLVMGLQTCGLAYWLIPSEIRQALADRATQFIGTTAMPYALLGVAVFPYVLGILGLATLFRHKQRPILANHAELLALLLGIGLSGISLENPVVRSLNLFLSAITLLSLSRRPHAPTPLIYLTHAAVLSALISGIDVLLPTLAAQHWNTLFVVGTIAEWSLCSGSTRQRWRQSAWYGGLVLAGLSYWFTAFTDFNSSNPWTLILILIPIALTYLANRPAFAQPSVAIALCGVALVLLVLMLFNLDLARLICLGTAAVLMGLNVRPLAREAPSLGALSPGALSTAAIAIGFGLALGFELCWQFIPNQTLDLFAIELALAAGLLWLGWSAWQRPTPLPRVLEAASNGWAIALSGLNLFLLNFYTSTLYLTSTSTLPAATSELFARGWALAAVLLLGAIAFRVKRQPTQLGQVGLAWNLELVLLMGLFWGIHASIGRLVPDPAQVMGWAGAIAAGLALGMVLIPAPRLGWIVKAWWLAAALLPGVVVLLTAFEVRLPSLLLAAAFYAALAKVTGRVRLSYLTLGLLLWGGWQWLSVHSWLSPFWLGALVGGSLLWVAQIDPTLQASSARQQRHWLRSMATGLVCLAAIYQSEVESSSLSLAFSSLAFVLSFGFALVGVLLKVRGFLYVGTVAFGFQVLRQVWLLVNNYSFLLWVIGILLGAAIIWSAATFESRRSQFGNVLDHWFTELQAWD